MRVAERYRRDSGLPGATNDQISDEVLGVNKALATATQTASITILEEQQKKQKKALKTLERFAKQWTERETSLQIIQQCMRERTQVLVGVDIEAYEYNHKIVTEIGIATLDLSTVDNARKAEPEVRHLRPKENVRYKNKVYVPDHSEDFSFGKSEVLPMKRCASELQHIFSDIGDRAVFVAHGSVQDIKWLNSMGVKLPTNMPQINTQHVWNQLYGDKAPAKLEYILRDLGIKFKNLHNAANDAYYTVQAAVRMGEEVEEQLPWWPRSRSQSPSQSQSSSPSSETSSGEEEASSSSSSSS
ncbi:hypothetical protein BZA70DRAFT_240092 [Myxozyma melibiosi]|uniref:Gfd2/YDR514C-like C-terminal domain-containing protein n=1 Tax=Myxozyma melibiosi TaxID=54550 RepID=A0ABR1F2N8_9ASCO